MVTTAKVFKNGASQAVRLPKEFRFDSDEVCIKHIGSAVLLFAKDSAWALMEESLGQVDEDFMTPRNQPVKAETRKSLDARKARRSR
jgi:antitoxin VapB